jgi:hypothetical protein
LAAGIPYTTPVCKIYSLLRVSAFEIIASHGEATQEDNSETPEMGHQIFVLQSNAALFVETAKI